MVAQREAERKRVQLFAPTRSVELFELANSSRPIERRTAITAALWLIRGRDINDPLPLADILVDDSSVLVTKPVGAVLREVGKVDQRRLAEFLGKNRHRMDRSTLRIAIGSLPEGSTDRPTS